RRVVVNLEEVGRAEVLVALRITCRDRVRLDHTLSLERLQCVRLHAHNPFELFEATTHLAESHVAHRKSETRMRRIDCICGDCAFGERTHVNYLHVLFNQSLYQTNCAAPRGALMDQ